MTLIPNPWSDIPNAPAGKVARRRVNSESKHELLWFRDENGYPGLFIEIERNIVPDQLRDFGINMKDVPVNIIELTELGYKALSIQLTDENKIDIFFRLCIDITDRVTKANKGDSAFHITCNRIKKWQSLFLNRNSKLLTGLEVQGLFTEIYFLNELLDNKVFKQDDVIIGWKGPERAQQDFILDDIAIEIKSLSGQNRGRVRISSEDQLFSHLSRLFLRVYLLNETYSESEGENLNTIIRRVSAKISKDTLKEIFENKLDSFGYIDLPEYDYPQFQVKTCQTYLVSDGFPRIIRNDLPGSIQAVSYDLLLAEIESFRTNNTEIWEK